MTNTTGTFTVAIAGFGWWGKHIATRLVDHPTLKVVGIVEPATANHKAIEDLGLTVWTDLAEPLALAEVDAVILTTPNTCCCKYCS